MSDYTPSTDEARHEYAVYVDWKQDERRAAFDRMLESVQAEARAEGAHGPYACCKHCVDDPEYHAENAPNTHEASCTLCDDVLRRRAEKAEAERDELAAVVAELHWLDQASSAPDWPGWNAHDWVWSIIRRQPADLLAERDDRMRAEGAKEALLDAARAWQSGQWANAPRDANPVRERIANGQYVLDWLRARAERFPALHDTEAKSDDK